MSATKEVQLDVYNMPKNIVYQFNQDGHYVWKVDRYSTLEGKYPSNVATEFVEVYALDDKGNLVCEWSGGLIGELDHFGPTFSRKDGNFGIFSYDMDKGRVFKSDMPLKKVPKELSDQLEVPKNKDPWPRYYKI